MLNKWFVAGMFVWAMLMATFASAQGVADRELVTPFPQSVPEVKTVISSPAHRVLLSPVREVNNEIRSESMVRIPVEGHGQLYQIKPDSSRDEARDHYIRQIQALGGHILFECSARSCGRSNVWANQIFGQATLYGRDNSQDYLVAAIEDGNGERYLLLVYTVTRGNQREYIWVEQLRLGEGALVPGFATANTRVKGPVVVPWTGGVTYRFDWTADDRRDISNWAGQAGARVLLIGYSDLHSGETLDESLARASEALDSISAILNKSGVSAEQQSRIVVGPAVVSRNPGIAADRIEVVVITPPGEAQ